MNFIGLKMKFVKNTEGPFKKAKNTCYQ
jgi:hypothetical protein